MSWQTAGLRKAVEWLEEQRRKAESDPILRFQYEMMRPSIEALWSEAVELIEGKDAAGEKVAAAACGKPRWQHFAI
jgi:hypothetical protein